ncbi:hypothetical protein B0H67DRAFT_649776 [Lasiosphaeris hirsuta]|uniref:Uncharacterized protein n=1 Tax=Lasiosphaeris hirsuta TaxID=260670 RepID=A0AA39ZXG9_9PEZI|nr:hypothetical protein B0H67DRAFT_649776 [Lasiosphaeris hirsuta]
MASYPATAGYVTSIQLFRLGFSTDDDENPDTIYVSVDYECLETKWPPVVGEIQQFLRQITYADLKLHLEDNIVEQCTFPLVPSRRSPAEIEARQREMRLVPEIPYQTIKSRLPDTLKESRSPSGARAKEQLDDMVAFFDNGRHVFDTALVKPLDEARVGENRLPTLTAWAEKYDADSVDLLPELPTDGGLLQEPTEDGLRGLAHSELVYKVGATTAMTLGKFSCMKSDVVIAEDRHASPGLS